MRNCFWAELPIHPAFVEDNVPHENAIEGLKLKMIAENPKVTRLQMSEQAKVSQRTIGRYLKQMSERVKFVGSGDNGYWEIIKRDKDNM